MHGDCVRHFPLGEKCRVAQKAGCFCQQYLNIPNWYEDGWKKQVWSRVVAGFCFSSNGAISFVNKVTAESASRFSLSGRGVGMVL